MFFCTLLQKTFWHIFAFNEISSKFNLDIRINIWLMLVREKSWISNTFVRCHWFFCCCRSKVSYLGHRSIQRMKRCIFKVVFHYLEVLFKLRLIKNKPSITCWCEHAHKLANNTKMCEQSLSSLLTNLN